MSPFDKMRIAWRNRACFRAIARHSTPSFSQYGEDIVFDQLLKPGPRGTYVDVGAHHPINGSNTFRLYMRGWSGLTIDPNPLFVPEYRKYRGRDIFLNEGIALKPGTLTYYAFDFSVFNTFDPSVVKKLLGQGEKLVGCSDVSCRPLAEVVDQHLKGRHIDLLNVDCEGFDVDVLDSLDLATRRPTVIMVEDYPRYVTFQRALPSMRLERFLRERYYLPLAQTAWSGIYVAEDWRDLFVLTEAFHESKVQNGYMPGQISLSEGDL